MSVNHLLLLLVLVAIVKSDVVNDAIHTVNQLHRHVRQVKNIVDSAKSDLQEKYEIIKNTDIRQAVQAVQNAQSLTRTFQESLRSTSNLGSAASVISTLEECFGTSEALFKLGWLAGNITSDVGLALNLTMEAVDTISDDCANLTFIKTWNCTLTEITTVLTEYKSNSHGFLYIFSSLDSIVTNLVEDFQSCISGL